MTQRRNREAEKRGPLQAGEMINTLILKAQDARFSNWQVQCVICSRKEWVQPELLFRGSAVCTWCHTPRSLRAA